MPTRVGVANGVIVNVAVEIEILGVGLVRRLSVRRDEPRQQGVVGARVVVQQPGQVQPLAGVIEIGLADAAAADLAPRVEALLADNGAAAVGRDADAAELVAMQVGHAARLAHGDDLAVEAVVGLGGAAAVLLPQPAEVVGRGAALDLLDALAVGVVAVDLVAADVLDGAGAVLEIPGDDPPAARGQVAVAVVGVGRPRSRLPVCRRSQRRLKCAIVLPLERRRIL